jgi:hypothetical protein
MPPSTLLTHVSTYGCVWRFSNFSPPAENFLFTQQLNSNSNSFTVEDQIRWDLLIGHRKLYRDSEGTFIPGLFPLRIKATTRTSFWQVTFQRSDSLNTLKNHALGVPQQCLNENSSTIGEGPIS